MDKVSKKIKLADIRIDGGTQLRNLNMENVADLRAVIQRSPSNLPNIIAFFDGKEYWLGDGFHRYHAYVAESQTLIPAEVRPGTQRDALLYACGANSRHGLPRTSEDKRRCVGTMLADEEWRGKSDNWIAEKCVVSYALAHAVRKEMEAEAAARAAGRGEPAAEPKTRTVETKNGRKMNVDNIGKSKATPSPAVEAPVPTADEWEEQRAAVTPAATKPAANPMPPKVTAAIADVQLFDSTLSLLAQIIKNVHAIAGDGENRKPGPAGLHLAHELQKVETDAKNIRNAIRFTRPHHVCPYCGGKGCVCCKDQGWVIEQIWQSTPEDLRDKSTATFGGAL